MLNALFSNRLMKEVAVCVPGNKEVPRRPVDLCMNVVCTVTECLTWFHGVGSCRRQRAEVVR